MSKQKTLLVACLIFVMSAVFLTGCRNRVEVEVPMATTTSTPAAARVVAQKPAITLTASPQPTATPSPSFTATPLASATATAVKAVVETIVVEEGGFSFQTSSAFMVFVERNQASIVSSDNEVRLILSTGLVGTRASSQEFLDRFLENLTTKISEITMSAPYTVTIDGLEGQAIDITGEFQGEVVAGRVAVAAPEESQVFVAYGLAPTGRWEDEGVALFDAAISTVSFSTEQDSGARNSRETLIGLSFRNRPSLIL